ncbi:hypothetical protein VTK56DRAFT_353 [Thermocarpiscus australiensis]
MSSSPCLKGRISSPLETGPSVADGHHLPNHVSEALEYASKQLGREGPHIKLLAIRRDYQLLTSPIASPTRNPASPPSSAASTPSRPSFPASSKLNALKQLVRHSNSGEGQIRERILHIHLDRFRNGAASPAFSESSTLSSVSTSDSTFSHRPRWPGSSTAYGSVPVTPATPFTVMSSAPATDSGVLRAGMQHPTRFGMKLVYVHPLDPRKEKRLSQALEKAAKKFKLDPNWLPQAVCPCALGLPADLVRNSSAQNEMLFSSEHLTLLSLDHLYTFRTALEAYARTQASSRLEDAVDELRRLILANGRRPLRKSALLAAYPSLGPVNGAALTDICRMYERAYGGIDRENGVEDDLDSVPARQLPEGVRNFKGAEPAAVKRMGMAVPDGLGGDFPLPRQEQHQQSEPQRRSETPLSPRWAHSLDKEMVVSSTDIDTDGQSEFDAIEAWYRNVRTDVPTVPIDPLRSHPPTLIPPPPPPPQPAAAAAGTASSDPPTAAQPEIPLQPDDPELEAMRRTTPKLQPPPPGRHLALKLQTTFDKPVRRGNGHLLPTEHQQQQPQTQSGLGMALEAEGPGTGEAAQEVQDDDEDDDEEEEELTARPHSAIKPFAAVRWTADRRSSGGGYHGASIDGMLRGEQQPGRRQQEEGEGDGGGRVGPMTPNGYDDISPVTRGEWGFLMFGKSGRTAKVEMC